MKVEKKKKLTIVKIVIPIVISFYLISGILSSFFVNMVLNKVSTSSISILEKYPNTVFKTRSDYPSLENRTEHVFKSGKNKLYGYYYDVIDEKGLIISSHGLNNLSDGSNAQMHDYFVNLGYDVFAIDLTASGRSEGHSTISLFQSAYDIKNAYQYLVDNNLMKDNLILVGHSWGGYGSAIVSKMGIKANKVITFSAYDGAADLIFHEVKGKIGFLSYLIYPTIVLGNLIEYGDNAFISAANEIKNNDTEYLVIQGEKDGIVPYGGTLYKKTLGFDNVTSLYLEGVAHDYPWLDLSSVQYIRSLNKKSKKEDVDLEKSSQISPIVDAAIREFLF